MNERINEDINKMGQVFEVLKDLGYRRKKSVLTACLYVLNGNIEIYDPEEDEDYE